MRLNPSKLNHLQLIVSKEGTVIVFSRAQNCSKLGVTNTVLVKISGLQNKTKKCRKEPLRRKVGMVVEEVGGREVKVGTESKHV